MSSGCGRGNRGRALRSRRHEAAGSEGLQFIAAVERMLGRCQLQVEDFFPSGDADSHRFAGGQEKRGVEGILRVVDGDVTHLKDNVA